MPQADRRVRNVSLGSEAVRLLKPTTRSEQRFRRIASPFAPFTTAHPDVAAAELIFESAIDALGGTALVVAHVSGKFVADVAPCQFEFLSENKAVGIFVPRL